MAFQKGLPPNNRLPMNNSVSAPGTYLLLLECSEVKRLKAGRLGDMTTAKGFYLYTGSAFGPGGVRARIHHHARMSQSPHWHIDYLRAVSRFAAAWCCYHERLEHQWAQALQNHQGMESPLKGFGSSDCNCATHLFFSKSRPTLASLERMLGTGLSVVEFSG
jgi:Uri superfamily endonuclease